MKLPDLKIKLPGGGATKKDGGRPGIPKVVGDLYADLRDRRLLPLVVLLLVAIVAAPILLAGGDEEEPLAVAPITAEEPTSEASFAVVPAEPGLRDPSTRLSHREPRDPFMHPEGAGSSPQEEAEGGAEESPAPAGESETPSGGSPVAPEEFSPPAEEPPTVITKETTKTETNVVVQNNVIDYTIDAKAGFGKEPVERDELTQYTQLPNEKNPVVVYMGVSPDHQRALFLMTNQVTAYYGDGHCALEKESCQLLELKPGKSATFAYGLEEKPFKLTLKSIDEVVNTKEKASTDTTKHSADAAGKKTSGKEHE